MFEKATLTYTSSDTALSSAHYGIHFRAAILFIDEWQNSMSVVFKEGTEVVHAHFFSMEFIMGEYLCGRNFEDHIEVADFWYAHTTASIDL